MENVVPKIWVSVWTVPFVGGTATDNGETSRNGVKALELPLGSEYINPTVTASRVMIRAIVDLTSFASLSCH